MNRLILDKETTYQTFDRFGVSGAWWAQVVGGWEETDEASGLPKRERVAELLFDREKGIGVRCYRYNLGAGSMRSGKGRFDLACRRAESFDVSETDYDWTRDANAVWMMKEAVKRGADEVILMPIYPARETNVYGVTSDQLAEAVAGRGTPARCLHSFGEAADEIREKYGRGDCVITVGAGDVEKLAPMLVQG